MAIRYVIHACPQRMWFVREYIIPSMLEQGIRKGDISVWNDKDGIGNLQSFMASCNHYGSFGLSGGAWHMQDDVIIRSDFKQQTEKLSKQFTDENSIICGYAYEGWSTPGVGFSSWELIGKDFPDSFQCIYIPFRYLVGFSDFVNDNVKHGRYLKRYAENKYDDFFFKRYILLDVARREEVSLFICVPTLVEHIGELIGGSIVNGKKEQTWLNKSACFNDRVATEKFMRFMEVRQNAKRKT